MVRAVKCTFCGRDIEPGSGLMYVLNDGTVYWFCSSKCWKNFNMKRDPRAYKWTLKYGQQQK